MRGLELWQDEADGALVQEEIGSVRLKLLSPPHPTAVVNVSDQLACAEQADVGCFGSSGYRVLQGHHERRQAVPTVEVRCEHRGEKIDCGRIHRIRLLPTVVGGDRGGPTPHSKGAAAAVTSGGRGDNLQQRGRDD